MLGCGVFLLIALAPTALALWFLRAHRPTWAALSIAALAFSILGLAAVSSFVTERGTTGRETFLLLAGLFGIVQMLGSPLWAASFALFAWLAPERTLRRRLVLATALEVVIGGLGFLHFLGPTLRR
jgi:hypothetical protein